MRKSTNAETSDFTTSEARKTSSTKNLESLKNLTLELKSAIDNNLKTLLLEM